MTESLTSFPGGAAFAIAAAFVFGSCIGSFLNVLIWRLPREKSIGGRSQCPNCNHTLSWFDLVPLLSFLSTRGRCRYCQKPVSFRYPLIEVVTGFLFAYAMYQVLPGDLIDWLLYIKIAIALCVCVLVFVIDLEHFLILDRVVFPGWAIFIVLLIANAFLKGSVHELAQSVLGGLGAGLGFWLLWFISKGKWMGYGDVKFVVLMGLMLGWPGIAVALFLSFIIGAVTGMGLIIFGKKQMSSKLPFGTFLTIATVIALFWGQRLWEAYWHIYGL